jgi:hypothetical protein
VLEALEAFAAEGLAVDERVRVIFVGLGVEGPLYVWFLARDLNGVLRRKSPQ